MRSHFFALALSRLYVHPWLLLSHVFVDGPSLLILSESAVWFQRGKNNSLFGIVYLLKMDYNYTDKSKLSNSAKLDFMGESESHNSISVPVYGYYFYGVHYNALAKTALGQSRCAANAGLTKE